jgi:hypothetical protein
LKHEPSDFDPTEPIYWVHDFMLYIHIYIYIYIY